MTRPRKCWYSDNSSSRSRSRSDGVWWVPGARRPCSFSWVLAELVTVALWSYFDLSKNWFGKLQPATSPCWSPRMFPCFLGTLSASRRGALMCGGSCTMGVCSCCCPSYCGTTRWVSMGGCGTGRVCVRAGAPVGEPLALVRASLQALCSPFLGC